ncbi:MAG: phosphate ABC transporter permease subunit PstC [Hellea sp.]
MSQVSIYMMLLIAVLTVSGYVYNRSSALTKFKQARAAAGGKLVMSAWHSQASYHGYFTAWIVALSTFAVFIIGLFIGGSGTGFNALWLGAIIITALAVIIFTGRQVSGKFRARTYVERFIKGLLIGLSVIAVLTTLGIIASLLFESLRFFKEVPFMDFLFGLQWSPQTAMRADQVGQSGSFGAIPVFAGTFLIMLVAMTIAGPIGLMIAIYLTEYASSGVRKWVKPAIEILAGVPTVVYGFFALLTFAPFVRGFAESLGFSVPTQSALAAGVVMGVMIIPFVSSLSSDVINAVPQTLRDGSAALGATKSETMKQVVFTAALPGIIGAFMLAISRAIGETMIVYMAAGKAANLTGNPFEAVTTVTVQIVALLTGDSDFDSPKTLVAFALGLVLFVITLLLNVVALTVVRRYRAKY